MKPQRAVLVLNNSFEPISICGWKRAVSLVIRERAEVIEHHDRYIHVGLMLPSVIRLNHYRRIPYRLQELTRRNILIRDGYRCGYCAKHIPHGGGLTLDHVIPRSQGGPNTWENLTACCSPCNRKKSNRTPEEAGMPLLSKPRPLTIHTSRGLMRTAGLNEEKWRRFLYYDAKSA